MNKVKNLSNKEESLKLSTQILEVYKKVYSSQNKGKTAPAINFTRHGINKILVSLFR